MLYIYIHCHSFFQVMINNCIIHTIYIYILDFLSNQNQYNCIGAMKNYLSRDPSTTNRKIYPSTHSPTSQVEYTCINNNICIYVKDQIQTI